MDLGALKKHSNQGLLESPNIEEMRRADLAFVTSGNSFFRLKKDLLFYENYLDEWTILFLPGDDSDTEEFKNYTLGEQGYCNLPVINNPLYLSTEAQEFFQRLLARVLPKNGEKKKRKFLFWK